MTFWHRSVLVADVLLASTYVLPWILRRNKVFPWRARPKRARWVSRFLRESSLPDVVTTAISLVTVVWISLFVAIFPWERSPHFVLTRSWFMAQPDLVSQGPGRWFSNRLVLPDQNLIEGFDLVSVTVTRFLRNRSFVAAVFDRSDLRQVDFTGSNLDSASFNSADLRKAKLGCAYLIDSEVGYAGCVQLRDAILDHADMRETLFTGATLFGASLQYAKLEGATLDRAWLEGTKPRLSATLDGASLILAGLDGALASTRFVGRR